MGGVGSAAYKQHRRRFPRSGGALFLVDAAGYAPPANFDYRILYGLNPPLKKGMKQLAAIVFYNKLFPRCAQAPMNGPTITAGDGSPINSP